MGRIETGPVAEQRVQVRDAQGGTHLFRRIRVKLDQATRDGDQVLYLLTNVPLGKASATRVARLYRKRWTLETCQSCNLRRTLFWPKYDSVGLHTAQSARLRRRGMDADFLALATDMWPPPVPSRQSLHENCLPARDHP